MSHGIQADGSVAGAARGQKRSRQQALWSQRKGFEGIWGYRIGTGDQYWLLVSDIPQVEWLGMTTRCGKRVVEVEENSGIVSFLPMDVEISQVGAGFRVEEETYRKLQYFRHLMWRADSLEKTLMLGKIEGRRRRGWQRMDEIVGYHHWLNGHECEQTPGDNDGDRSLVSCSPWGQKESNTT